LKNASTPTKTPQFRGYQNSKSKSKERTRNSRPPTGTPCPLKAAQLIPDSPTKHQKKEAGQLIFGYSEKKRKIICRNFSFNLALFPQT
jgi:hypothetical protein